MSFVSSFIYITRARDNILLNIRMCTAERDAPAGATHDPRVGARRGGGGARGAGGRGARPRTRVPSR